jgi:hypothetical protein
MGDVMALSARARVGVLETNAGGGWVPYSRGPGPGATGTGKGNTLEQARFSSLRAFGGSVGLART